MNIILISKFGTIFMLTSKGVNIGTAESMADAIHLASAIARGLHAYDVDSAVRVGLSCGREFSTWKQEPHIQQIVAMLSPEFLTMVED